MTLRRSQKAPDSRSQPPLERLDLEYVLRLIQGKKCFILHAPRETGKTSALLALQDLLNSGTEGSYRCVYMSFEAAQGLQDDIGEAMREILGELASFSQIALQDDFVDSVWRKILDRTGPRTALQGVLRQWAQADPRPIVLLIDEIDALHGDTLLSVLQQLRSRYFLRPKAFPQSIVLCGMRDMRDYRIYSPSRRKTVASPCNIVADSMRIGDFTKAEVLALLGQHTARQGKSSPRRLRSGYGPRRRGSRGS